MKVELYPLDADVVFDLRDVYVYGGKTSMDGTGISARIGNTDILLQYIIPCNLN